MITRTPWRTGNAPSAEMLRSCLQEHLRSRARLDRLHNYYSGKHAILKRTRTEGLPNNCLTHGFPRYITAMASGYLIGNPVGYLSQDTTDVHTKQTLEAVLAEYQRCAMDSVDAELARNASIYGRSVELVFADEAACPRSAALDPRNAFVVYGDTVAMQPLFGVYMVSIRREDGEVEGWRVHVFTDTQRVTYRVSVLADFSPAHIESTQPHYFDSVPMIEYWNDESECGDFEGVLSLIDAYDALESDRVNDKQQFVDALLLLYGCTMETDARGRSPGQQLREDKALALPDSDAHAEWLCKQMNEADTEVLKNALKADSHKMSLVPDLTDENFAGNTSGVAMRYKLLGLEQLTKIKERWFREGLRLRLKLYAAFMQRRGAAALDVAAVRIMFTRALPVNELEIAQTLNALDGLMNREELTARADALLGQK